MGTISLSEGEWKIMKALWSASPCTIGQIVDASKQETGWSKTTVFVMLKRLIAKGAVRMDDSGRLQQYYPLIKRRDAALGETEPSAMEPLETEETPVPWSGIVRVVWITGSGLMGVWFLLSGLSFRKKLHRDRRQVGTVRITKIYISENVVTPCLVGLIPVL